MTALDFLLLALLAAAIAAAWWQRQSRLEEKKWHQRESEEMTRSHAESQHAITARMGAMLDSMIEGLIVIDERGRVTLANRAAERLFSFSRMMVGGTLLEIIRHHEVAAIANRVNAGEEVVEHEVRLESPVLRVLQISAVALRDAAQAPAGAVLVFHDVTRLRELEGVRQDFVANVSHELRTPLSLIKSAAETLIDGGKDDATALTRVLEIIDKNANRLTLLIDDLLLLAQIDSGRVEVRLEPLLLAAAVQDALDDFGGKAASRGVTLMQDVPPYLIARADPNRLRQVLANLIDNAIKYGAANGRVVARGRALVDGRVEFSIRDNGPGIPPDSVARIFERFYRVDKARSRDQGGTGLGLAIVKNVVQAHGGEVRVESTLGVGTEFFVTLPAAKAD
jgi:two-component system phosphate regulon sensor histidine kinase PhoR